MKYKAMVEEQARVLEGALENFSEPRTRRHLINFAITAMVNQFNDKITALETTILELTTLIAPEHVDQARKAVHNLKGGSDEDIK